MSRECLNNPDAFCWICKNRPKITDFINKVYQTYFGAKLEEQDKTWAPRIVCIIITTQLCWDGQKVKDLLGLVFLRFGKNQKTTTLPSVTFVQWKQTTTVVPSTHLINRVLSKLSCISFISVSIYQTFVSCERCCLGFREPH